jgi:hypothetical protein
MNQEEVVASAVLLAHPINVRHRDGKEETLETVGEAASFLLVNFSGARSADTDWKLTARALEHAAEADSAYQIVEATHALIALFETEKLIRR